MMSLSPSLVTHVGSLVLLVSALAGCESDPEPLADSGQSATDSSVVDLDGSSGPPRDDAATGVLGPDAAVAPVDANTVVPDSSTLSDSSMLSDASTPPDAHEAGSPDAGSYQEIFDQGLTKWAGMPQVQETEVTSGGSEPTAIDVHHFSGEGRGPLCMYGDDYFVETRKGSSDTLMIFLQGGGVCLNEICAATPSPLLSLQLFDLLDPYNPDNPMKDFDVVAAPYCDGSLFSGDVDRRISDGVPDNGDDQAYQRGLQNLTATLETAKRYFPQPPRIVLVGSSGGAYGVITGTALTRYFYPDTPLLVLSDSGAPIVNGVDKGFITRALSELNATSLVPRSCADCLANGHATGILEWALSIDPKLHVAYMTHARDHVIGEFFMRTTPDQFEAAVVAETDRLLQKFPGRAFRFVLPGARHTLAMGIDNFDDGTQGLFLGLASGALVGSGVGFTGDDVDAEELATWTLGGMKETGTDANGKSWTGNAWIQSLLQDPEHTPSILQLK
jgi:hypothetical protein